jgi:hypothetical protein
MLLGRVDKGIKCSVQNCSKDAARSIAAEKAKSAGLKINVDAKRTYLCKEHYKEFKKNTKKEKLLDKWRFNA